jgi:uncharacterized membrane-anchored protein YhcB (DUF1043 family)
MDKNKISAIIIGVSIGLIIGFLISKQLKQSYDNCNMLKQENQMLRDMLINQQDPYRPDTTSY